MKNVLQEQMLKAGLVTEEQVDKANRPARRRPPRGGKKSSGKRQGAAGRQRRSQEEIDLARAYAARRAEEKREAARKKAEAEQRRKNREKVARLIRDNMLDNSQGEVEYQFIIGSTIKKIWVTPEQRQGLLNGELGVTFLGGKRCLIPVAVAEEILRLDPKKAIALVSPEADDGDGEFAVPDDLIW